MSDVVIWRFLFLNARYEHLLVRQQDANDANTVEFSGTTLQVKNTPVKNRHWNREMKLT